MDIIRFLNTVDEIAGQASKEDLIIFIHGLASKCKEYSRNAFINELKRITKANNTKNSILSEKVDSNNPVYLKKLRNELKNISNKEYSIIAELKDEYNDYDYEYDIDDWYDQYYYIDENGIAKIISNTFDVINEKFSRKDYSGVVLFGNILLDLQIQIDCDTEEIISIFDLPKLELLSFDVDEFGKCMLCSTYFSTSEAEKAKEVCKIFMRFYKKSKLMLSDLIQFGNIHQNDLCSFFESMLSYLGNINNDVSEELFYEALNLINNEEKMLDYILKNANTHPGAYLYALDNNYLSVSVDKIKYGMDVIKLMNKDYIIRSKIALRIGDLLDPDEENLREQCLLSAFESHTTALNYLRYFFYSKSSQKNQNLNTIFNGYLNKIQKEKTSDYDCTSESGSIHSLNMPLQLNIHNINFLIGNFDVFFEKYINTDQYLSWSSTYIHESLAMLLFIMSNDYAYRHGILKMLLKIRKCFLFTKESFYTGLHTTTEDNDNTLFITVMNRWKKTIQLSNDNKNTFINRIELLVDKRVAAIMENDRRDYYGECAEFIAAIGEVLESWGKNNAKNDIMLKYKLRYPRRRSFIKELHLMGMKG